MFNNSFRNSVYIFGSSDYRVGAGAIANPPRSADAVSCGHIKLTYIDTVEELDQFLELNPGFAKKMVKVLAARLGRTDELLKKELCGRSQATMIKYMW